jgi:hypothetical protein
MSIIGKRFGRLVVIEKTTEHNKSGRLLYLCKCDCGTEKKMPSFYFTGGDTKSCGCLLSETTKKRSTKHGLRKSKYHKKVYYAWLSLRDRCNNKTNETFNKYYRGKGIKVCERWNDFTLFLADMGMPPEDGKRYSVDRIDVNGDYCPENCRWATDIQQANNRTNNRYIEQDGVKYTVADFCRKNNISEALVRSRIAEGKTTIDEFLTPKGISIEKQIDYKGMVLQVYPNAYCKPTKGRESIWVNNRVIAKTSSEFSAWRLAHKRIKAQCL